MPGGGITPQGKWRTAKAKNGKFLFPVKAMSKVFRAKYCALLKKSKPKEYQKIKRSLWQKPWVVYAKRPLGGPEQVVNYLGRYTHKIAISNHRLQSISNQEVVFSYKDYKQAAKKKKMSLSPQEFIRRFAQHILPKRFVRIRHYGILSSYWKREKLKDLQIELDYQPNEKTTNTKLKQCPICKKKTLEVVLNFDARGPPALWKEKLKKYKHIKNKKLQ